MNAEAYPVPDIRKIARLSNKLPYLGHPPSPSGTNPLGTNVQVVLFKVPGLLPQEAIELTVLRRLLSFGSLELDWDSYGGYPISLKAVQVADALFKSVTNCFYENKGEKVHPYDIAPLKSGGVQLEWRGLDCSLEVEIQPDGELNYLHIKSHGGNRLFDEQENATTSDVLRLLTTIL